MNAKALRLSALLGLVVVLLSLASGVSADPASDLSAAESRAAGAEAEVETAHERLAVARGDYAAAAKRSRPYLEASRAGRRALRNLEDQALDRQRAAQARIVRLEERKEQEEEDHDDELTLGIGLGLGLLIAAGIALSWSWFRSFAAVAWLARVQLGQAVALCVGGGFLMLAIGAAIAGGNGFVAVLGNMIATLGLILPAVLLLARHSVEVERGKARPLLGRGRLPGWVARGAAALLLLLGFVMLVSGVAAEDPDPPSISAQLREEAGHSEEGPEAARLTEARAEAVKATEEVAEPVAEKRATARAVRQASRQLRRAQGRLLSARASVRQSESRLAALVAEEEREAEAQAEQDAEEAEELAIFEEEEAPEASGCDPNYSGCVPAYPPDVDCAEVGESVSSYGTDPHGLDADGDGIGCE